MVKTSFLLNIIANMHYVTHCSLDFALLITKLSNAYLRIHLVLASGKELAGKGSHSQFSEQTQGERLQLIQNVDHRSQEQSQKFSFF